MQHENVLHSLQENNLDRSPRDCDELCCAHRAQISWDHLIATVALRIRRSLDLQAILQTTVNEVRGLLMSDRILLYQFEPDWSGRVVVESISAPQWSLLDRVVYDTCFEACWLKPYQEGQVRAIADVNTADYSTCYREFLAQFQVQANLVIPVLHESQLWGLLIAHSCTAPCSWRSEAIDGLQQIAVHVGIAIHQAELMAQLQAAKTNLEAQVATRTQELEQSNQQLLNKVEEGNKWIAALSEARDERFQLAAIVESSQDAIISKTPDGIITSWNQAAERLFGYTAPEVIGQHMMLLIPPEHQAEEALILQRIHQGKQVESYETQRQHKDGHLIDVSLTISPIRDENGVVIGASKIVRDISAQLQSQQALQEQTAILDSFYNSSPLMMGVVELSDDDILHVSDNRATADFFHTTPEALKGKWATALGVPSEMLQAWMTHYRESQRRQQPVRFDYAHTTETQTYWLSVVVSFVSIMESQRPRFSYVAQDISDRKQAELALQQSEATNRALIAAIPDFLVRMRQDGLQMQVINEGVVHMLRANDAIACRGVAEIMPTAIAQERINLAQVAITTGQMQQQEYEFTDHENTHYEEARIVPLWKDEVLVVVRDVSDRKRSELDLKSAKDQLELVLQASSEGFWDWDLVTEKIYFSPEWKAMLGYADHELENSFEMWASVIFEDDRITALQLIDDYNNGRIDAFAATQRFHHKDGSTVYVLSRAIHLKDDQDHVLRMVGSHLNMTQLVQIQTSLQTSEMQLSGILNGSLDGIMAFRTVRDHQGSIIDFEWLLSNPTACDIIGRRAEDLIGQRLLEQLPGNRESGLYDLYVQVVESGEPMQRQFYYNHDGMDCWFENISVKLGDGFAVTFRDITAIKHAELALQQTNQQLEERVNDLNQRHTEMVVLNEISDFLQACLTVEEACETIANLIEPLFPKCSGGIFTTSSSRDRLEKVATWGTQLHSKSEFQPHSCWGLRRGRSHWVGQNRGSLRCNHVPADAAIAATLCVPMIAQGETLGLFYLSTETANALSETKQQLARTLAEQVGMAIANLQLRETLQHQSIRDPLTGLFNRRYLEESFTQEIMRAQRKQHAIGVIMIDIDHFKRFNDTFGHDTGDHVLQTVGALLKDNIRNSDIACRYGGEEMTLILPEASLAETIARAEMIRESISQLRIPQNGKLLDSLTASFGVACFPQHGSTSTTLIKAADTALYRAKEAGRNQVLVAL